MTNLKSLAVIIVVCSKDKKHLNRVIRSMIKSSKNSGIILKFYVFLNKTKVIKSVIDDYKINTFYSDTNIGYGNAINWIMKSVKNDWCVIANPDTFTDKECFFHLRQYFDPYVSIIAPMVFSEKNVIQTTILEEPSLYQIFLEQSYLSKSLGVLKILFKNFLVPKGITPIRFSEASWWLINKSKYLKSGGFDRNFFLYFEDIDLCKRISRYGKIIYNPYAKVIHYGHQSNDGMVIPEKYIESLAYYLNKYHSPLYTKICMLIVLAGSFLRLVFWLLLSLFNRGEITSRKIQYYKVIITETLHIII